MKIWQTLMEALLPRRCVMCEFLSQGKLFCSICEQGICHQLHGDQKNASYAKADLIYAGTVQKAIQQAKFGPDQTCAQALVAHWFQLRHSQLHTQDFFSQAQAVCFVPLHWRRRVKRGFDFPSLIARAIASMLQLPILDALVCKRLDKPLSLSSSRKQRELTTQGRYRLRVPAACVAGKQVLLVDDVVTTGSTLRAAARVLQEAGAVVHRFALARVFAGQAGQEMVFQSQGMQTRQKHLQS